MDGDRLSDSCGCVVGFVVILVYGGVQELSGKRRNLSLPKELVVDARRGACSAGTNKTEKISVKMLETTEWYIERRSEG